MAVVQVQNHVVENEVVYLCKKHKSLLTKKQIIFFSYVFSSPSPPNVRYLLCALFPRNKNVFCFVCMCVVVSWFFFLFFFYFLVKQIIRHVLSLESQISLSHCCDVIHAQRFFFVLTLCFVFFIVCACSRFW
jgi:hypothetical protein